MVSGNLVLLNVSAFLNEREFQKVGPDASQCIDKEQQMTPIQGGGTMDIVLMVCIHISSGLVSCQTDSYSSSTAKAERVVTLVPGFLFLLIRLLT